MRRGLLGRTLVVFLVASIALLLTAGTARADVGGSLGTDLTRHGGSPGPSRASADPSTILSWDSYVKDDTSNVGRIWTDKTVSTGDISAGGITVEKGDAAFLTALTALSSTSNLTDVTTTPLDIVLVLDASGSMSDAMGSGDRTARIEALRAAANAFVDEIAEQNEGLSDETKQHRVALVKFAGRQSDAIGNDTYRDGGYTYNYSQIMKAMSACTAQTKADFKDLIDGIDPAGATNAEAGLALAQGQTSGRPGAKKVVIFFTDGTPTTQANFSDSVANGAVEAARAMKAGGAVIYSIGIFSGADPATDPTSARATDVNKFMHAVSSNYPSATYAKGGRSYTWSFGERATDAGDNDTTYYKSASNADELSQVFSDISREIVRGTGYPTKTTEGQESASGFITFADRLGAYMRVSALTTIVYDGKAYPCESKTTDGNVDTFHFSGEVDSGASDANLSDIVVRVTRSDDAATGDLVQVLVPASLIPQRHFVIDLAKKTMRVDETKPVSVFYESDLKDGVAALLANPDEGMRDYIEANTDSATGRVRFLANDWNGGQMGDATAAFEPADENGYYYFTRDTPIYEDESCTRRATEVSDGATYYYAHDYYERVGGAPVARTVVIAFPGGMAGTFSGAIGVDAEGAYFKAGTARLSYINQLRSKKTDNVTQTATDVLNPQWNSVVSVSEASEVTSHLGNNGVVLVELPAMLAISKTVTVPAGYDVGDCAEQDFAFEVSIPEAAGKSFAAQVFDADDNPVGDAFKLEFDADGKASHTIRHGQVMRVYGLDGGWGYEVSETPVDGFRQTDPVDGEGNPASAQGELTAGEVSTAAFSNARLADLSYTAAGGLSVAKTLVGHDMSDGQFTIVVVPEDAASASALGIPAEGVELPMPAALDGERVTASVLAGRDVTFGQTDVGKTYRYRVYERSGQQGGYTYDTAERTASISVTGDATASLTATTTVLGGPEGTQVFTYTTNPNGEASGPAVVAFANSYRASTDVAGGTSAHVVASRELTGRDLAAGEFSFGVRLADGMADVLEATNVADGSVDFGTLSYTTDSLSDLVEAGHATKGASADGRRTWEITYVAYEKTEGLADVGITAQTSPVTFTVTVTDNDDGTLTAVATLPDGGLVFRNLYETDGPVSVGVSGAKRLLHDADLTPGDIAGKFTFTIAADEDGAPLPSDDRGQTVATATNDGLGNIDFGQISFTLDDLNRALGTDDAEAAGEADPAADSADGQQPDERVDGTPAPRSHVFTYTITESGSAPGVTNDPEAKRVSVRVTDNGTGRLSAEVLGEADGTVVLDPVTYDRPGTHSYRLREVGAGTTVHGVAYDGATYQVTTTVSDDGDGGLTVTHSVDGTGALAFRNAYADDPVPPDDDPTPTEKDDGATTVATGDKASGTVPRTGDDVPWAQLLLALLGGTILVFWHIVRPRRS